MPGKSSRAPPYNPLGGAFMFLLGRNGHDGSAGTSPDPLLLAPDPFSWYIAHQTRHNLGSYNKSCCASGAQRGARLHRCLGFVKDGVGLADPSGDILPYRFRLHITQQPVPTLIIQDYAMPLVGGQRRQ